MDWINVVFIVALIYLFSSIQKRKNSRQSPGERQPERPRIPLEQKQKQSLPPVQQRPGSSQAPGGYDYEVFRKKLRQAWNLPEAKKASADSGDVEANIESPVAEPSGLRQRPLSPVPSVSTEETEEKKRQKWLQEYAARLENVPRIQSEEPVPMKATTAMPSAASVSLTEQSIEQWVVFDAVFGKPRSLQTWQPHHRPQRG